MTGSAEFVLAMGPVARELLGEPTEVNKAKREMRYGSRGSLCIDLGKGTWFDNEAGQGGGLLDFVQQHKSVDRNGAMAWLQERGHVPKSESGKRVVATYDYTDATGELLFQVVRFEPKDFRQRRPDGTGGWLWKMAGVERVLYRLPQVTAAVAAGCTIFIAEGEKAVHALESIGAVATCSPGGAGKWRRGYREPLAGADVVILPDNDPQAVTREGALRWHADGRPVLPGQDHAADVASQLQGIARRVRILMLPNLPLKGDAADWIAAGGTVDELDRLIDDLGAAEAEPPQAGAENGQAAITDDAHLSAQQTYLALRETLAKNGEGAVLPTHANLILILKGDPTLQRLVQFNAFTGRHMLRRSVPTLDVKMPKSPGPYPRPWDSDDLTRLLAYVQKAWAHNFKKATVEECLLIEGRDAEVHPVRDYLNDLKWDGKWRVDQWLTMTFGCDDDPYHRSVGSKMLIAAVRRVRRPGCKFDCAPVLEGAQGIGKSTALVILFGTEWSTDHMSDLAKKDSAIDLAGKWCCELSEIEHLIRADVETVKAFLSRATDHYRPPYGRTSIDVPRQGILVGTTNADEYLRDATGNRRIWPVRCRSTADHGADLDWLRANRDQIWAEAAHREANGETIFLDDAQVRNTAVAAQAERLAEDPWDAKVKDFVEAPGRKFVTVPQLLEHALLVPTFQQTKAFQMRVGDILKRIGWQKDTRRDPETKRVFKGWYPPEAGVA